MKYKFVGCFIAACLIFFCFTGFTPAISIDEMINGLISKMTLEEKIGMLHADSRFTSAGVERLAIPSLHYSDGPNGVREENHPTEWKSAGWTNDSSSYLPSVVALTSTWNVDLARESGIILGKECKVRGKNISLAPGINIHRTLLNGRNWEYMSEDPYLVSRMVVPYIQGVQSQGVASCVKHYALNNQEQQRGRINVEVDERTLREIYLPGFEAAIKEGGALAIMGAYNKLRREFCCENNYLLNDILKNEWGFKGIAISDWGAVHNTYNAAMCGLDVEMGTSKETFDEYYMARPLLDAVKKGEIPAKIIDDKIRRILYVMFKLNMFNEPRPDTVGLAKRLALPESRQMALKIAEEAIVLLKNNKQLLPLDIRNIKSIAVIGVNASEKQANGGQSAAIKAKYEITPLEGLKKYVGNAVKITYARGYASSRKKDTLNAKLFNEAITVARQADVVLYVGGLDHNRGGDTEGSDKTSIKLPYKQDSLINALCQANPNIVVTLISGGPVEIGNWFASVPALLQTGYIGMEGGNALARIIFGDVNPSGKLPDTWPKKLADTPPSVLGEYPGKDGTVRYNEGIMVGYRYYDVKNVEPQFCFGYGLSYTTFGYSNLIIPEFWNSKDSTFEVKFTIMNTGKRKGKEVSQLYIHDAESSVVRPYKELKGFAKTELEPGESKQVSVLLNRRALQFYDVTSKSWVAEPGQFEILIGSSSKDLILKKGFILKK